MMPQLLTHQVSVGTEDRKKCASSFAFQSNMKIVYYFLTV